MTSSSNASSLHGSVFRHAEDTPHKPAVVTAATQLSYLDLAERVLGLAGHLAAGGVGQGDRVMVALPNTPATIVAGLAIQALGATPVEVNRAWSADILGGIVDRCHARNAIVWGRDARVWGPVLAGRQIDSVWTVHSGPLPDVMLSALRHPRASLLLEDGTVDPSLSTRSEPAMPDLAPDDTCLILFTSGSTGTPHGVPQTFRNIASNTRSIVQYLDLTAEDRALLTLPLYYCYGRSVLQTHLYVGGSIVLDNRFALPLAVMETIRSEGCTGFAGVPLTFEILRRQVDVGSMSFPTLRYVTQAGGAMTPETVAWARRAFAPAPLYVMYGQTEATARLSWLPPEHAADKAGSIGIPIPGVELRVMDPDGQEVEDGNVGELVARGENVMSGYLDEPEETNAILHDGWLWTGDLAYRDQDGYFFHRGRAREILKIGGHRVSPVEIEHVVGSRSGILEAAVCGVPDPLLGEVPVAFIVPARDWAGASELRDYCRERLPAFQVPVEFIVVDALPRNEAGKLMRTELPQMYTGR